MDDNSNAPNQVPVSSTEHAVADAPAGLDESGTCSSNPVSSDSSDVLSITFIAPSVEFAYWDELRRLQAFSGEVARLLNFGGDNIDVESLLEGIGSLKREAASQQVSATVQPTTLEFPNRSNVAVNEEETQTDAIDSKCKESENKLAKALISLRKIKNQLTEITGEREDISSNVPESDDIAEVLDSEMFELLDLTETAACRIQAAAQKTSQAVKEQKKLALELSKAQNKIENLEKRQCTQAVTLKPAPLLPRYRPSPINESSNVEIVNHRSASWFPCRKVLGRKLRSASYHIRRGHQEFQPAAYTKRKCQECSLKLDALAMSRQQQEALKTQLASKSMSLEAAENSSNKVKAQADALSQKLVLHDRSLTYLNKVLQSPMLKNSEGLPWDNLSEAEAKMYGALLERSRELWERHTDSEKVTIKTKRSNGVQAETGQKVDDYQKNAELRKKIASFRERSKQQFFRSKLLISRLDVLAAQRRIQAAHVRKSNDKINSLREELEKVLKDNDYQHDCWAAETGGFRRCNEAYAKALEKLKSVCEKQDMWTEEMSKKFQGVLNTTRVGVAESLETDFGHDVVALLTQLTGCGPTQRAQKLLGGLSGRNWPSMDESLAKEKEALRAEKEALRAEKETSEKEAAILRDEKKNLQNNFSQVQERLQEKQQEIDSLKESVAAKEKTLAATEQKLEQTLAAKQEALAIKKETLETLMKEANQSKTSEALAITRARALANERNTLAQEKDELETETTRLSEVIEALNQTLSSKETEINLLNEKLKQLEQTEKAFEDAEALKAALGGKDLEIKALNGKLEELKQSISGKEKDLSQVADELQRSKDATRTEHEAFAKEKANLQEKVSRLEDALKSERSAMEALQRGIKIGGEECASLELQLKEALDTQHIFEAKIKDLEKELQASQLAIDNKTRLLRGSNDEKKQTPGGFPVLKSGGKLGDIVTPVATVIANAAAAAGTNSMNRINDATTTAPPLLAADTHQPSEVYRHGSFLTTSQPFNPPNNTENMFLGAAAIERPRYKRLLQPGVIKGTTPWPSTGTGHRKADIVEISKTAPPFEETAQILSDDRSGPGIQSNMELQPAIGQDKRTLDAELLAQENIPRAPPLRGYALIIACVYRASSLQLLFSKEKALHSQVAQNVTPLICVDNDTLRWAQYFTRANFAVDVLSELRCAGGRIVAPHEKTREGMTFLTKRPKTSNIVAALRSWSSYAPKYGRASLVLIGAGGTNCDGGNAEVLEKAAEVYSKQLEHTSVIGKTLDLSHNKHLLSEAVFVPYDFLRSRPEESENDPSTTLRMTTIPIVTFLNSIAEIPSEVEISLFTDFTIRGNGAQRSQSTWDKIRDCRKVNINIAGKPATSISVRYVDLKRVSESVRSLGHKIEKYPVCTSSKSISLPPNFVWLHGHGAGKCSVEIRSSTQMGGVFTELVTENFTLADVRESPKNCALAIEESLNTLGRNVEEGESVMLDAEDGLASPTLYSLASPTLYSLASPTLDSLASPDFDGLASPNF